jgi:AmmeMemoRadiSam system protein B
MEAERQPSFAGHFYPAQKEELETLINELFDSAKKPIPPVKPIKAMIVPHAGYVYSGIVAAAAYTYLKELPEKDLPYPATKQIIILGPLHDEDIEKPCASTHQGWMTPLGTVEVNHQLLDQLGVEKTDACHANEHSIEVQIPFLQKSLKKLMITPISLNQHDPDLASKISQRLTDDTIIVISSDLSHYMPYDIASKKDGETMESVLQLNSSYFDENGDACGKGAISTVMNLAKICGWTPHLIDYKNSGDTSGDKDKVVGYASIGFFAAGENN